MGNGLDRALGFIDGVDGAVVIKLAGDGGYTMAVQHAKEVFPCWGSLVGVIEKRSLTS
jgi:hypothetical protein